MMYVFYLDKYNSYTIEDLEHNPLLVILGAGMAVTLLIGPYFFYRPVNTMSYAEMLEVWLIM
jgi:hypothetical protein